MTSARRHPVAATAVWLVVLALLLAGCAGSSAPAADRTRAGFSNPVVRSDFPDPGLLQVDSHFYAYGTNGDGGNVQTLTSTDLVHWRRGPDALPTLGRWASTGSTWAPEVLRVGSTYLLTYVAHDTASGKQCIGVATASRPQGPFHDTASHPFVCQVALGGSIDPDPVRDADGHLYLYWKNDGNCCGKAVHLWGARLRADGQSLTTAPQALLTNRQSWQGNLVEAPEMLGHDGAHLLFYSANDYASTAYGIGYATCSGPLGPCTDASRSAPWLGSDGVAAGPGHCYLLTVSGRTWVMFHAWPPDAVGSTVPGRQLWLQLVSWSSGTPHVSPPTLHPGVLPVPRAG
jgi:beta-xylosidase